MEWQLRFDGGRQQRYLPDRRAVLHYVLQIGSQTNDPRFEVWAETEPLLMADGTSGGRRFELREVLDLGEASTLQRIQDELNRSTVSGHGG